VSTPQPLPAASPTPAVLQWRKTAAKRPTAYAYRRLADACLAAGLREEAARTYHREALMRRAMGDVNAAEIVEGRARRWESLLEVYQEKRVRSGSGAAKHEPANGCYVGAIVERDDRVGRDHATFNEWTGKDHSVFYDYRSYGFPFPEPWTRSLANVDAAAHLAYEPNGGLAAVRDDQYLRQFAQEAGAADTPIFLRFAAEMNGDWTPYGGDPEEYVRKWRLIHRIMRQYAPNVAMVWAPNHVPEDRIARYYPGDEYVDWVGVNFYTVHHHNNSVAHPAWWKDPSDSLRYVYDRYSARKPIMVSEWAATHYCAACGKNLPQFAADKLRALYTALPRRYPRVKAVHWYDIDNTTHLVRPGRNTNNFSLTDNQTVLAAYREAVRSPYYLSSVGRSSRTVRYSALESGQEVSGTVRLRAWAKTYTDLPVVSYRLDGRHQLALAARPHEVTWDTTSVPNGEHTLEAVLFAGRRLVARRTVRVRVAN
jgi:hypothetical protein